MKNKQVFFIFFYCLLAFSSLNCMQETASVYLQSKKEFSKDNDVYYILSNNVIISTDEHHNIRLQLPSGPLLEVETCFEPVTIGNYRLMYQKKLLFQPRLKIHIKEIIYQKQLEAVKETILYLYKNQDLYFMLLRHVLEAQAKRTLDAIAEIVKFYCNEYNTFVTTTLYNLSIPTDKYLNFCVPLHIGVC